MAKIIHHGTTALMRDTVLIFRGDFVGLLTDEGYMAICFLPKLISTERELPEEEYEYFDVLHN